MMRHPQSHSHPRPSVRAFLAGGHRSRRWDVGARVAACPFDGLHLLQYLYFRIGRRTETPGWWASVRALQVLCTAQEEESTAPRASSSCAAASTLCTSW